jgi:hypothetical protein
METNKVASLLANTAITSSARANFLGVVVLADKQFFLCNLFCTAPHCLVIRKNLRYLRHQLKLENLSRLTLG